MNWFIIVFIDPLNEVIPGDYDCIINYMSQAKRFVRKIDRKSCNAVVIIGNVDQTSCIGSDVMHRQLHWLDVEDRVNYEIGLLVYKCLHGLAPGLPISEQCILASTFMGRVNMRSSSRFDWQLHVPRTKTKTGSTRVLLRLVCCVELASGGLAWSRTLPPLLQNKTEISLS